MNRISQIFAVMVTLMLSTSAYSADGTVTGYIDRIDDTGGTNYAFRIRLEGDPPMCGNANKWAYVNESDSNYQTYVSTLLAAKMAGAQVNILSDQATSGYCNIIYMSVY